jgi:hypothetical protein
MAHWKKYSPTYLGIMIFKHISIRRGVRCTSLRWLRGHCGLPGHHWLVLRQPFLMNVADAWCSAVPGLPLRAMITIRPREEKKSGTGAPDLAITDAIDRQPGRLVPAGGNADADPPLSVP